VGPLQKIRLSYPTLLLWVAVLNTNMAKIKYAQPKILVGHLVGSRGPQFVNHWFRSKSGLGFRVYG